MKKISLAVFVALAITACGSYNSVDKNGNINGQAKWHTVKSDYQNSNTQISHNGAEDGAWANSMKNDEKEVQIIIREVEKTELQIRQ